MYRKSPCGAKWNKSIEGAQENCDFVFKRQLQPSLELQSELCVFADQGLSSVTGQIDKEYDIT